VGSVHIATSVSNSQDSLSVPHSSSSSVPSSSSSNVASSKAYNFAMAIEFGSSTAEGKEEMYNDDDYGFIFMMSSDEMLIY